MKGRFRGVYGRQLAATLGTGLLALVMLGAGFSAVLCRSLRAAQEKRLAEQAENMAALCVDYLREGRFLKAGLLRTRPYYQSLRVFHSAVSGETRFFVCDAAGDVLLASDPDLEGLALSVPEAWMEQIAAGGTLRANGRSIGLPACPLIGVPVPPRQGVKTADSEPAGTGGNMAAVEGAVFVLPVGGAPEGLWAALAASFCAAALITLAAGAAAAVRTASRMARPLGEMLQAIRRYSERDFSARMSGDEKTGAIGELAASFNEMGESLQRQELRRREFISDVSHDLKTPLTTIAGYTDGILDGTIPPESQRRYLQIISEESRRLSRMVRRMLDVSQYQAIDPLHDGATFELCECARRVIISMEKKITDRNLDVDADIPYEPIQVYGDGDMITQVLYNLLENAAKFAAEGSTLYLGVAERDGKARVTLRNVGETIPPEEIPLLFERFHKSDKSRGEDKDGVGLGLYIVKTILDQHREKIYASSKDGVTEFAFSLRLARGNGKYALRPSGSESGIV